MSSSYHSASYAPTASPPSSRRFRDYSPTKSSPLRYTASTRSQNSDVDDRDPFVNHTPTTSTTTTGAAVIVSQHTSPPIPDVPEVKTGIKRDRSESPVKKSAAFAKWEQREQSERSQSQKMDISPKKIRDDDWRSSLGRSESRIALGPVTQNASQEKTRPASLIESRHNSDSKENISAILSKASSSFGHQPSSHNPDFETSRRSSGVQSSAARNSLATLSRADSVRASSRGGRSHGHVRFASLDTNAAQLDGADLDQLGKSSTPQLRQLGQLVSDERGTEDLSVHSADEQVTGLLGRRKLQRSSSVKPSARGQSQFSSQYASTKWMDTQRRHLQAYEYLCHIGEARAWIEDVLEPVKLPPIVQLEEALRNGITLAEIVVRLVPSLPASQQEAVGSLRIFRSDRLQYRHSDNIAMFFRFLAQVELPELFRFELVDLYEKKNIPKVIYCIHALSWLLYRKNIVDFRIGNLLGQLQFEEHELEEAQKGIDRSGVQMPNFGGMRQAMEIEEEPPPPEPSPEEQLAEQEAMIVDLQTQVRGALVRMRLGETMQDLWDAEHNIAMLQALARAKFAREVFDFQYSMKASTQAFQAAAKAYLVRRAWSRRQSTWSSQQDLVVSIQSLWRAKQQRAKTNLIRTQLRRSEHGIKGFQAAIRGALSRWKASDLWHETRELEQEAGLMALQAAARGALLRMSISRTMNSLWDIESGLVRLQSLARGGLTRKKRHQRLTTVKSQTVGVVKLQSAARGLLERLRQKAQHGNWQNEEANTIHFQAAARGLLERLRHVRTIGALQGRESGIIKFQALLRAHQSRSALVARKSKIQQHATSMARLQARIRAVAEQRRIEDLRANLRQHEKAVLDMQSHARAVLQRRRIGEQLAALENVEDNVCTLQSLSRAYLSRQRVFEQLVAMEREDAAIVQLQSMLRAMMLRGHIGTILGELEEQEASIIVTQAALRGFIVRKRFVEKRRHYRENMEKVIKLQSFVRAKQQGESYKSLVNGKNPPLPVVRRHVHLLTDSHLEFEGEMEAERLRRQVVDSVRRNEQVESYVEGLDVKIALLVKNKITLDEVVKHQKHFGGSASQLLRSGSTVATSSAPDLKALNKSSRKKLTAYEELFFIVQTQAQYLASHFARLSTRGIVEKEGKQLERLVMILFGYAQKSREEFMLLKLLAASSQITTSSCQSVEDFMRLQASGFHSRLFLNYARGATHRQYLKALFGSMVKDGICGQEHLDLESDPLQIYRAILNNEELSTGRQSQRPRDLPREVVIRQEDVRPRYVEHLEDIRDLGDSFMQTLEEALHRMPYSVRYLASDHYRTLSRQFPHEDPLQLALTVGAWLWKSYMLPALREPEMWGVIDRGLSPAQKRNLAQVVLVLGQVIGVGRLFGSENIYLQPLNSWVAEALDRWQEFLRRMFEIPSPEEHYDADQLSDLYARNKPTLYIKLADIFALHGVIAESATAVAPTRDDPVKELLADLGSAKSNEADLGGVANGGEITLTLKSRFTVQEDPNAGTRTLFMATKRLVLYIIRVQSGSNLMEILLRPITHEDADRWVTLLREDMAEHMRNQRGPRSGDTNLNRWSSIRGGRAQSVYSETPSAVSDGDDRRDMLDLQSMSYAELKSTALENILALEQPNIAPQYRVSRHNNYQEILNALAADIRQKHRRRLERQRETESTKATIAQLDAKAHFLEDQLRSYNDYIEQCLHTLASKKGSKHRFILPFTKQWSHERELERAGRQPKFGSYKYSARQLADKGVLLSWQGYSSENWGQLNVVISSDEVGVFHLEASSGSMILPGAAANLLLDDLLQAQYDNKGSITVFDEAGFGGARLAVNLLLHMVFKKFYRDE